ncbi:hypothetical protein [Streptomyces griseus]|uniref:cupin domain-containing protein n=1 Tax=Streptomyces griseus TaxID=1911 RepID=UPI00055F5B2F|nr:hypothetical protein [Streptomyces griseus]
MHIVDTETATPCGRRPDRRTAHDRHHLRPSRRHPCGDPPGGGLPEHDLGASQIVLIPVAGSVQVRHGQDVHTLVPGSAAHVDTAERVSLANLSTEPASLMVVASPPEFAYPLAAWPIV